MSPVDAQPTYDLAEETLSYLQPRSPDRWERGFEDRVPFPGLRLVMWEQFLIIRHGLSPSDVQGRFSEPGSGLSEKRQRQLWRDKSWRTWADKVMTIEVDVKPGGRLVAREPDSLFSVEIRWKDFYGMRVAELVTIIPDDFFAWTTALDLDAHMMACHIQLARTPQTLARLPARRPRPGESYDPKFYRTILDRYSALLGRGHPAPVREIAESMNANRSTVKSWLKRGREYLKEEGE